MARGGPKPGGRERAATRGPTAGLVAATPPSAPVPLGHPAMLTAVAAIAVTAFLAVTFHIFDTDFWQHLLVGRSIWETRSAPTLQLWTWPTYGAPDVNASWGFRALVWPFWSLGGVAGLFLWRWLTTLASLGILWALGRRMGGRAFASLVALLACALVYRLRSQIRPETLVGVLLALQLWVLESRRPGGRDRALWLVAIAWGWANAHISWYLGPVLNGVYLVEDLLRARNGDARARARARRLAWIGVTAIAIAFVNPWGWRALMQPVEYQLQWRQEPIFRTIVELRPVDWNDATGSPLGALLVGWPLLIIWRAWRVGSDRVEIALCLLVTTLTLTSRRFMGPYALVALPFIMRDTAEWARGRRWPVWTRSPAARAGLIVALCGVASANELRRADPRPGVAIDYARYPVRACDFIAEHGIGGRGFNNFEYGGYQAWRFWPDRERLPFIDVHQAGTRLDRRLYVAAFGGRDGWQALDDRHHFDYCLITRERGVATRLPDVLDADPRWALVFIDDAATLYVRREGRFASVVERYAYRLLPGGETRLGPLGVATASDSVLRRAARAELERAIASSPWCAGALSLMANLALAEGRYEDARALLERGLAVSPRLLRVHERLGRILLEQDRPREAMRAFERERALAPERAEIALLIGTAWQRLGEPGRARDWYRRELRANPSSAAARDSLAALDRADGARGHR